MATCEARRMLISLISLTEAAPTPTAAAHFRISPYRRSRCCTDNILESRTPLILRQYGLTTSAAATTGPARQAMPTSSTPAMRRAPPRQSAHSKDSVGSITTLCARLRRLAVRVRGVLLLAELKRRLPNWVASTAHRAERHRRRSPRCVHGRVCTWQVLAVGSRGGRRAAALRVARA